VNRPFRTELEASAELEKAAVWYESRRPGLGLEFLEAVDATLERIARWPQAARRVPRVAADIPARKAPVSNFPYHVAYLETPDSIRILAFAHDSREPGYWHSRIRK
jgi:toxin ParE1/3/4